MWLHVSQKEKPRPARGFFVNRRIRIRTYGGVGGRLG